MARNLIDKAGPDYHDEVTVAFKKNKEGFYKKIITNSTRDRKVNTVEELEGVEQDGLYALVLSDDYDEKIAFEDLDGIERFLKFKLVSG